MRLSNCLGVGSDRGLDCVVFERLFVEFRGDADSLVFPAGNVGVLVVVALGDPRSPVTCWATTGPDATRNIAVVIT